MTKRISFIQFILLFLLVFHQIGLCQSQSQYALIRRPVFTNPLIWKLTKSVAWSEWGVQLFIDPASVAQSYIMSPSYELYSGTAFFLDNGWNRVVYSECLDNWIRAYGDRGSGTGQFLWPDGVDAHAPCDDEYYSYYYYIYVADAVNNRIVKLKYDWRFENQTMSWDGAITGGGLDLPQDLDINNGFDFFWTYNDYLWVLNGHEIKRFTMDGVLHNTYGSYGCDEAVGHFCRPTAIVCARNAFLSPPYDPYANTDGLYVADAGNYRIVRLRKLHGGETIYWISEIVASSSIVDLEVDNFGQVWAVDSDNGRIYKYTSDLYPLCYFGSWGTGENQFYYPCSFSNTGGYLGCGDVFVAEAWTDSSGGQYFAIGTDVVDFFIGSSEDYYWHFINYTLIDPSIVSIKIYNQQSSLVKTPFYGSQLSGSCALTWDGSDQTGHQVSTGDYRVVLIDSSGYGNIETGGPVNVVTKEAWVYHVYNPNPPTYIPGDCNNDAVVNVSDIVYLINYLFVPGSPAPNPFCIADVNDDGMVNISDVVWLINYLYLPGSAAPKNGCD